MLRIIAVLALLLAGSEPVQAQVQRHGQRLTGPRFGVTVASGRVADRMQEEWGLAPVLTQFGWQFETEFFRTRAGHAAVTEWVPLAGGLEQGRFIPSLTWLVGLRTATGAEVAVGPNLSAAGVGLALAGGVALRLDEINVPINLAVVPSAGGMRASLLTGFNIRQW